MKMMKNLLCIVLTTILIIVAIPIGTITVHAQTINCGRIITVPQTGIYVVEPPFDQEYGVDAVWDERSHTMVQYCEKQGGYPLVAGQEYTAVIKGYDNPSWILTKVSDTIFPDVKNPRGWEYDAVHYAVGAGIMKGYDNKNAFGVADGLQRQDFIVMLARLDGVDLTEYNYESSFADVKKYGANAYFKAAVNWAVDQGITTGYAGGINFGVGDLITRQDTVTFLHRYAKTKGYISNIKPSEPDATQYPDYNKVLAHAQEPMIWAIAKGAMSGKGGTHLAPNDNIQRCEIAQIMYNIYKKNIFKEPEREVVRFASTIDPKDDGTQYVIDSFEEKYGIDVEIVPCTLGGYIYEMQALIANDRAPDVGRSNGDFPACLAYFDSLDKAEIDYTDPIWNQNTFKMSTFNGSPYMCDTWGSYWSEMDIVIYSKSLLRAAGCPTPKELNENGAWTWDNFMKIAEECTKKMGAPAGFVSPETALHMAGGNVFKLENEEIVSGIDANTSSIIKKFAQAWKNGCLNDQTHAGIINGTTAIATGSTWSLRKDGPLGRAAWADLGFWSLPSYEMGGQKTVTGFLRGFGIMRGAKNPVGGGKFLRYYLDVNNYDTKNAFINEDAKNLFFLLTTVDYTENYNPYLTYLGLNEYCAGIDYSEEIYSVMKMDPSVVDAKMASVKDAVDKGVKNFNNFIQTYKHIKM